MKKQSAGSDFEDLLFVIQEINRIQENIKERTRDLFDGKWDPFYGLPHPSGHGHLAIGQAASHRFYVIAQRAIKRDKDLKARIDVGVIERAIKHTFAKEILASQKELTRSVADKIVSRAIKYVKSTKLQTTTHFYPCLLPGDKQAERFSIGPISFTRTAVFLRKRKLQFRKYLDATHGTDSARSRNTPTSPGADNEREKSQRRHTRFLLASLIRYYRRYPWVAEIEVAKFEKEKSARVAALGLTTAVNILKLFFSLSHAEDIRVAETYLPEPTTARLTEVAGDADISVHHNWSTYDDDGWVAKITAGDVGDWLALAGSLIPHLVSGAEVPLLYQRYANALWWYGEGITREDVPYLRIVSFCNALEAFLGTRNDGIGEQVASRASRLLRVLYQDSENWKERIKKLYDLRSGLVHGRIPAFDDEVSLQVGWAAKIVRGTLIQGLEWTLYLAQNDRPDSVEKIDSRLEVDLPRYCSGDLQMGSSAACG